MYTFTSEDPKTNLSLIHLQNLQAAAEITGSNIGFVEGSRSTEPVTLTYDIEDEKVTLNYVDYPEEKPTILSLNDCGYILNTVILY